MNANPCQTPIKNFISRTNLQRKQLGKKKNKKISNKCQILNNRFIIHVKKSGEQMQRHKIRATQTSPDPTDPHTTAKKKAGKKAKILQNTNKACKIKR